MNLLIRLVNHVGDRIHHNTDAQARAIGMEVTALRWGGRSIRDPRVAVYADRRRARIGRDGADALDRALAATVTRHATRAAAAQRAARTTTPSRLAAIAYTATVEAAPRRVA